MFFFSTFEGIVFCFVFFHECAIPNAVYDPRSHCVQRTTQHPSWPSQHTWYKQSIMYHLVVNSRRFRQLPTSRLVYHSCQHFRRSQTDYNILSHVSKQGGGGQRCVLELLFFFHFFKNFFIFSLSSLLFHPRRSFLLVALPSSSLLPPRRSFL